MRRHRLDRARRATGPESLRVVLARYFDLARLIVERHGGAVEKFIGDAVMAIFGVIVISALFTLFFTMLGI